MTAFFLVLAAAFLYAQNVDVEQQKKTGGPASQNETMQKANEAASELMKLKMQKDAPVDYNVLKKVQNSDVVVVKGVYDHLQDVLNLAEIPYTLVEPEQVDDLVLNENQFLMINCPGSSIDERGIKNIEAFVKKGGYLFTTDWTVKHVLERAFPGIVKYNEHPTGDDVVRVEILDAKSPFVKSVFTKDSDPVWWLESSSYPVAILEPKNVHVLIVSKELKDKYGENPVAFTFSYGKGKVFHMISHFYLQRAELRTDRHKKKAEDYAKESLNLSPDETKGLGGKLEGVNLGEVESAYTSQQFIANIIVEQQKDKKGITAKTVVALEDCELKEKPKKSAKTLAKLKKGETVIFIQYEGKTKEWAQVETVSGKKGFILNKFVQQTEP